ALASWIETLDRKPSLVVAAGDHHNDLELLASAHIAAAPEDAAEEVLKTARVIMPPADRHGFSAFADWLLEWEKAPCEIDSPVVLS
ncbi:MAG: HAD hydrolase family protein, partial [Aminivibrio sp.]